MSIEQQEPINNAQTRVLELQNLLIQTEENPLKLVDIAALVQKPEATVLRDLRALRATGWAIQTKDGYWRTGIAWATVRRAAIDQAKAELHQMIDTL